MSEQVLSLWKGAVRTPRDTVREILQRCADNHGVTPADIVGDRRFKPIVHARQEAMYRLRDLRTFEGARRFSLPRIGQLLGGRDHTTILHGVRAHEARNGLGLLTQAKKNPAGQTAGLRAIVPSSPIGTTHYDHEAV